MRKQELSLGHNEHGRKSKCTCPGYSHEYLHMPPCFKLCGKINLVIINVPLNSSDKSSDAKCPITPFPQEEIPFSFLPMDLVLIMKI